MACSEMYPIAVSADVLAGVAAGDHVNDILNGGNNSHIGWLSWNGSQGAGTLVQSLTDPGRCMDYINPDNPDDHVVSVGDRVKGKSGTCNKRAVRRAVRNLKGQEIIVPVWDVFQGHGSHATYRITAFARVKITGYSIRRKRISATFLGFEACGQENQAPVVHAGADQELYLPSTIVLEGSVQDDGLPSGSPPAVDWSLVSGPGSVTFTPDDLMHPVNMHYDLQLMMENLKAQMM